MRNLSHPHLLRFGLYFFPVLLKHWKNGLNNCVSNWSVVNLQCRLVVLRCPCITLCWLAEFSSCWFDRRLLIDVRLLLSIAPTDARCDVTDSHASFHVDVRFIGVSHSEERDLLLIWWLICSISLFISRSRSEYPVESAMKLCILSSSRNKSSVH